MKEDYKDKGKLFDTWSFTLKNYVAFAVGIFTILVGYILMYSGETYSFLSTSLSPLILIIGYCFIIPFSILYNFKK